MNEIRHLVHEVLNALAIARGLSEGVQASLNGDIDMSPEQQIEKLGRSIKAMDRVEEGIQQIRTHVHSHLTEK
jgi:hypothetical protein